MDPCACALVEPPKASRQLGGLGLGSWDGEPEKLTWSRDVAIASKVVGTMACATHAVRHTDSGQLL